MSVQDYISELVSTSNYPRELGKALGTINGTSANILAWTKMLFDDIEKLIKDFNIPKIEAEKIMQNLKNIENTAIKLQNYKEDEPI